MDFIDRLTTYLILQAGWISWLLLGFTMGGTAVLLQRAYYLVTRWWRRRMRARRRLRDAAWGRVVEMSSPGLSIC